MIRIKLSVEFHPDTISNPKFWAMAEVAQITAPTNYSITITSAAEGTPGDGIHLPDSEHYKGWAIDIRIRDADFNLKRWVFRIQAKLGSRYYVLLEKNHIHIQFNG